MRKEINLLTGEVTEHKDATITIQPSPTAEELKALKLTEIDALEASQFMTRGEREGWLAMIEAQASTQGVSLETLYLANPFYKKLKDVNYKVATLRAEMFAIV